MENMQYCQCNMTVDTQYDCKMLAPVTKMSTGLSEVHIRPLKRDTTVDDELL
jgi:hypothetical protein